MFDIRRVNLDKLNSITKYPAIPTYHALGDKGILQEQVQVPFQGRTVVTEKIDGANARIICCPDASVLLGSREELLWERRDLIGNPSMDIVKALRERVTLLASRQRSLDRLCTKNAVTVYFLEIFGHGIGAGAANYAKVEGCVGLRLFDVAVIHDYGDLLAWTLEKIAHWREHAGQGFVEHDRLLEYAAQLDVEPVPVLLDTVEPMPTGLEQIHAFLLAQKASKCKLEPSAAGVPEGVVVRMPGREKIAKLRREDYDRTLKRQQSQGKK